MTFPQMSPGWCAHNSNYEDLCSMNAGIFHFCMRAPSPTFRPPSRSACGPICILARGTCQPTAFIRSASDNPALCRSIRIHNSIHPETSICVTDFRPWKERVGTQGAYFTSIRVGRKYPKVDVLRAGKKNRLVDRGKPRYFWVLMLLAHSRYVSSRAVVQHFLGLESSWFVLQPPASTEPNHHRFCVTQAASAFVAAFVLMEE